MKNFVLFILTSCFLISCSSSNTPESVALAFNEALVHIDLKKAKEYAAPESIKFLESMEQVMEKFLKNEEDKKQFQESNAQKIKEYEANGPYTCVCIDGDGENKKICEIKDKNSKVIVNNLKVEKIDGRWLVKISLFQ